MICFLSFRNSSHKNAELNEPKVSQFSLSKGSFSFLKKYPAGNVKNILNWQVGQLPDCDEDNFSQWPRISYQVSFINCRISLEEIDRKFVSQFQVC